MLTMPGSSFARRAARTAGLLIVSALSGCQSEQLLCCSPPFTTAGLRVVNAYTTPIDVLLDGNVVAPALPAGFIFTGKPTNGDHTLALRPSGSSAIQSGTITISDAALNTLAAVSAPGGFLGTIWLDDTSSVVPAGATKVRVLHLAPNAGELQVYRTQPDHPQPVAWQFPFTYQAEHDDVSAPFYQSTPGMWEIRVWKTPADASGWNAASVKAVIDLGAGEKKTVLILDNPGGGVHVVII